MNPNEYPIVSAWIEIKPDGTAELLIANQPAVDHMEDAESAYFQQRLLKRRAAAFTERAVFEFIMHTEEQP